MSRRAQRILAMSIFYLVVAATTLASDQRDKVDFVIALGVVTLAVGIATDRYHERSGHNDES